MTWRSRTIAVMTEDEIGRIIDAYRLQMARYEAAARHVESRLRREFRAAALPVLLSSRAKHPEDLREKLRRKVAEGNPGYKLEYLAHDVNKVVTDVAGCRVIVYDPRLEMPAAQVVRRAFLLDLHGQEVYRKPTGYRSTHLLVPLGQAEVELSIRDAICEVQITSIASHIFNELEHDIRYKMKGVEPGERVGRTWRIFSTPRGYSTTSSSVCRMRGLARSNTARRQSTMGRRSVLSSSGSSNGRSPGRSRSYFVSWNAPRTRSRHSRSRSSISGRRPYVGPRGAPPDRTHLMMSSRSPSGYRTCSERNSRRLHPAGAGPRRS